MADTDGMLLNFAIGEEPLSVNQTFKGGRWRDRLYAKKRAQNRDFRPKRSRIENASANGERNEHEAKRPRTETDEEIPATENQVASLPSVKTQNMQKTQQPNHQVISSLFSYNPNSKKHVDSESAQEGEHVEASNAPMLDGLTTFTTLKLRPSIAAHLLTKMELKAPTAIQEAAIPQLIAEDSDAFIQAQTGSGKTLAYLLPIVQRIVEHASHTEGEKFHRDSGLFAVILAPTRELCKQISVVLESLLRCAHWIVAGAVLGGEKKKSEKARLRRGLNILVATPGRLADHLDNTKSLDVSNVRWLVLDEGDRLMELGFEEDIKSIVSNISERSTIDKRGEQGSALPTRKVTILCSATMRMNVQRLGEASLKDAVHLKATEGAESREEVSGDDADGEVFSAPAQLKQAYAVVPAKQRLVTLHAVLRRAFARKGSVAKAIIFVSCADSVNFHFLLFTRPPGELSKATDPENDTEDPPSEKKPEGRTVNDTIAPLTVIGSASSVENNASMYKLHGSLPQHVRTSTLAAFSRSKEPAVLMCTDVASRGLDLPNVDFVVEYDPAYSKSDHLHRVGRTARAGRDGRALVFLLPGEEEEYTRILKESYRDGGRSLVHNDSAELLRKGFAPTSGVAKSMPDWEAQATNWQLEVERWALENPNRLDLARRAFQSHVRAYATHVVSEREIFNIKSLHLGHLAKSFALRDRPGNMNVPGLRGSSRKDDIPAQGAKKRSSSKAETHDDGPAEDTGAAGRAKMRRKMKEHMAGISEFNVG